LIVRTLEEVKRVLALSPSQEEAFKRVVKVYPFSSTLYYLKLAKESSAVRKMLLPSLEEIDEEVQREGLDDPLNEEGDKKTPFLTHRYPDRVLLVTTNQCPVLCRYCMRKRNWKRKPFVISDEEIERALSYISQNPKVRDVLISGGEPLSLPLEKLERLLTGLKKIETVEVVRIGTRLPVVEPEKVLKRELLTLIERAQKVWINTHFNHPDEVTEEAGEACLALLKAGAPVNNQTVLLKGVNDSAEVLEELFRKLQKAKVRPYYLFHCDPVKGVMHFSTPITKGLEIVRELFKKLSPLAIPYYAVDGPGGYGKVPLLPHRFKKAGNSYTFEAYDGKTFTMEDK
jgi:lysine 2,3-aminomutase